MDDFPLASLPLLGYTVGAPSQEDGIAKDFVFKLQYKNHVYFFRAESEYTYNRCVKNINAFYYFLYLFPALQVDGSDWQCHTVQEQEASVHK